MCTNVLRAMQVAAEANLSVFSAVEFSNCCSDTGLVAVLPSRNTYQMLAVQIIGWRLHAPPFTLGDREFPQLAVSNEYFTPRAAQDRRQGELVHWTVESPGPYGLTSPEALYVQTGSSSGIPCVVPFTDFRKWKHML